MHTRTLCIVAIVAITSASSAGLNKGDIIVHEGGVISAFDPSTGDREVLAAGAGLPIGGVDGYWMETDPTTGAIYYSYTVQGGFVGKIDPITGDRSVVSGYNPNDLSLVGSGPWDYVADFAVLPSGQIVAANYGYIVKIDPISGDRTLVPTSEPIEASESGDVAGNFLYFTDHLGNVRSANLLNGDVAMVSQESDWSGAVAGLRYLAVASPTTAYALGIPGRSIIEIDLTTGHREAIYVTPDYFDDPITYSNFRIGPYLGGHSDMAVDADGKLILWTEGWVDSNLVAFDPVSREFSFISGREVVSFVDVNAGNANYVYRGFGDLTEIRSIAIYLPEVSTVYFIGVGLAVFCGALVLRRRLRCWAAPDF